MGKARKDMQSEGSQGPFTRNIAIATPSRKKADLWLAGARQKEECRVTISG